MKILGWMHRKFRQNGGDPLRDFTGNPCNCLSAVVDNQPQHYNDAKQFKFSLHRIPDKWFFPEEYDVAAAADPDEEDYTLAIKDDQLFHGLLTIGTLGSSASEDSTGTATPTFGVPPTRLSVEAITAKEESSEATDLDLMVINSELEKVLVIPETDRVSSARASQVSLKQLVVSGFPLQEYLLGSSVEMAGTTVEQEKKEQHQRTSLGELFMESRNVEEGGGGGEDQKNMKKKKKKMKKREEKPVAAGVQLMVKKMLKRRSPSSVASNGDFGGGGEELDHGSGGTCETKLHKIIQMFHRKVHPENAAAPKKAMKTIDSTSKAPVQQGGRCGEAATGVPQRKESMPCLNFNLVSPTTTSVGCTDSSGNREQWIKTDADYLVLEL